MTITTKHIQRVFFVIIISVIAVVGLAVLVKSLNSPLMLDESEEASIGYNLIKIGGSVFSMPWHDLTHSLGYSLSHGIIQNIFGRSSFVLRSYGIFQFMLSLMITLLTLNLLAQKYKLDNVKYSLWFCGLLFFANPLLLQHSVIVNADNNLLTTAILLFVCLFIFFEREDCLLSEYIFTRIILAFFMAIALWAKELTPLLMLLGILLYRLVSREYKKLLIDFIIIGLLGTLIFWLTWWIFCYFMGTDILGFIKFTIIGKGSKAFSSRFLTGLLGRLPALFRWPIYWVSAPFWIGSLIFLFYRIKNYIKRSGLNGFDLIFFIGLCLWLPYLIFKPNPDMMKYQYPAYPFFIIILSFLSSKMLTRVSVKSISSFVYIVLLLLLAGFTFIYYGAGDYITNLWEPVSSALGGNFLWRYYLPLLMFYLSVLVLFKASRREVFIIFVILSIFPINIALSLNQIKADYATAEIWRNYGEEGQKETIKYLSARLRPDDYFFSRRDIAYALENDVTPGFKNGEYIQEILKTDSLSKTVFALNKADPEYIVLDSLSFNLGYNRDVVKFLFSTYEQVKVYGDFCILKKRNK